MPFSKKKDESTLPIGLTPEINDAASKKAIKQHAKDLKKQTKNLAKQEQLARKANSALLNMMYQNLETPKKKK